MVGGSKGGRGRGLKKEGREEDLLPGWESVGCHIEREGMK